MIEKIYYQNNRRQILHFNDLPTGVILKSFEIDGETKTTDREKAGEAGDFQTFNYLGKQLIHLSGDIIGDTAEEYIERRLNFIDILTPQDEIQSNRSWGTLYLQYYGQAIFHNDGVTLSEYPDIDIGSNPTVSPYTVTFKVWNPYWNNGRGGQVLI